MRPTTPFWAAIVSIVCTSIMLGQDSASASFPTGVSAELESEKAAYETGEPITIFARLHNVGTQPARVPSTLDPGYGNVEVQVASDENGPFVPYSGPGWGTREITPAIIGLKPGDVIESELVLLVHPTAGRSLDDPLPAFPFQPGKRWVRIRAFDEDFSTSIVSNPVEIEIRDPDDPETLRFARKISADLDLAEFLQTGDTGTDQAVVDTVLDHLTREHRSPLALAGATAVGRFYEAKDPEKALQSLRLVIGSPDAPASVRNRAEVQAIRILREQGSNAELRVLVESGLREPKRAAFRQAWTAIKQELAHHSDGQ